jgi:hypothetical protein
MSVYLVRDINDTFKNEQGLQSLAFFLIALSVGLLFLYPLLHVTPLPVSSEPLKRPRNTYRPVSFPDSHSAWPTLARLVHPAAFLLGLSKKRRKDIESGGESEEFERILDSDGSDEEEERNLRLRRLFGKPRFSKV